MLYIAGVVVVVAVVDDVWVMAAVVATVVAEG